MRHDVRSHAVDHLARQAPSNTASIFGAAKQQQSQLVDVPAHLIEPDPNQPRKDPGDLGDLAHSIHNLGLVHPLVVEAVDGGRYRILTGGRRFAACVSLGWEKLPCIIRTVDQQSRLALQLVENLQRKDLDPVEVAHGYKRLMDEFNLDQISLAKRLGLARSSVCETLRILDIAPELLAEVRTSEHVSKSTLLEIARQSDPEGQHTLAQRARAGKLTARQARSARQTAKGARSAMGAVTIALEQATVLVRFHQGEANPERVRAALEQALAQQT